MSLILDALNRSRESEPDIPGLASQHGPAPAAAGGNWLQWALAAGLVLAIAVIAWLLLGQDSTPPALVEQQPGGNTAVATRPQTDVGPEPAAVPEQEQAVHPAVPDVAGSPEESRLSASASASVSGEPVSSAATEVAALYAAPAETGPAPGAEPRAVDQVAEEAAEPGPTPVVAAPQPAESVPQEQPVDIESLVTRAEEELANARLEEHPAPFLGDLSQQAKDRIPTILYQRHDYSGRPGESSVVLNGKTLRPGGNAGSGVRVDEILSDSVVLSFQGTQFRLRALNSWVNL